MNCTKCGKKINKQDYNLEILLDIKCGKCSQLCSNLECKKKMFKSGYCSSHVVIENKKYKFFKPRCLTEEDFRRREVKGAEEDLYYRQLEQKQRLIDYQVKRMASQELNTADGKYLLRKMESSLLDIIEERDNKLDSALEIVKENNVVAYEEKITAIFEKGEIYPWLRKDYNNYKSKFKEYKEHFNEFRRRKHSKERRKAEKTRRGYEQKQEYESDDEDEDEYFERTGGNNLIASAFELLEVPSTSDYDEVRRAYKRLSLRYHPDKHQTDIETYTRKFLDLHQAYELICLKIFNIEV